MPGPTWVIDSSSLIQIKSSVPTAQRAAVFDGLSALVIEGRLQMPKQVVEELRRFSDEPKRWAVDQESRACVNQPTLEKVKETLAAVPDVIDPDKDSGPDEADPYVLAMALSLKETGLDARVVTEEVKDRPRKISLNTAAGILGIPCVPLAAFLRVEHFI